MKEIKRFIQLKKKKSLLRAVTQTLIKVNRRVSDYIAFISMKAYLHIFGINRLQKSRSLILSGRQFLFSTIDGKSYLKYFDHSYNNNMLTERAIEIPIVNFFLESMVKKKNKVKVLEVGNVSNYYHEIPSRHIRKHIDLTVVDKMEYDPYCVTCDIRDYQPSNRYDFIFSISTFEHMDSDFNRNLKYNPYQADQFNSIAFSNINYVLKEMLVDNGCLVITFPIGYGNKEIDVSIAMHDEEKFEATCSINYYYLTRDGQMDWVQVKSHEDLKYISDKTSYGRVNKLCVMVISRY